MPAKTKTTLTDRQAPSAPEAQDERVVVMIVQDGEKIHRLRSDELGPADRIACRQQTGLSLNEVLQRFDTDTPLFIMWMSRRKNGEPNLGFQQVISKYPTDKSLSKLEFRLEDLEGNEVDDNDPLVATP